MDPPLPASVSLEWNIFESTELFSIEMEKFIFGRAPPRRFFIRVPISAGELAERDLRSASVGDRASLQVVVVGVAIVAAVALLRRSDDGSQVLSDGTSK